MGEAIGTQPLDLPASLVSGAGSWTSGGGAGTATGGWITTPVEDKGTSMAEDAGATGAFLTVTFSSPDSMVNSVMSVVLTTANSSRIWSKSIFTGLSFTPTGMPPSRARWRAHRSILEYPACLDALP